MNILYEYIYNTDMFRKKIIQHNEIIAICLIYL